MVNTLSWSILADIALECILYLGGGSQSNCVYIVYICMMECIVYTVYCILHLGGGRVIVGCGIMQDL